MDNSELEAILTVNFHGKKLYKIGTTFALPLSKEWVKIHGIEIGDGTWVETDVVGDDVVIRGINQGLFANKVNSLNEKKGDGSFNRLMNSDGV